MSESKKGENNPKSKFTNEQVVLINELADNIKVDTKKKSKEKYNDANSTSNETSTN
jgi:hypothetical protein